jgi:mono/diheme cytochrome c family protein
LEQVQPKPDSSNETGAAVSNPAEVNFTVDAALRIVALFTLLFAAPILPFAQTLKYAKPPNARSGEHTFKSGCIACHGSDGRGTPQTIAGFERPDTFPRFHQV